MLRPSERWFWTYCPQKDRLLLDISDEAQFCAPFSAAQLNCLPQQQALSMAEAEAFWAIDDSLQMLALPAALRLELCLTALCAPFLQQTAHKSWYFAAGLDCAAQQFELVKLCGQSRIAGDGVVDLNGGDHIDQGVQLGLALGLGQAGNRGEGHG